MGAQPLYMIPCDAPPRRLHCAALAQWTCLQSRRQDQQEVSTQKSRYQNQRRALRGLCMRREIPGCVSAGSWGRFEGIKEGSIQTNGARSHNEKKSRKGAKVQTNCGGGGGRVPTVWQSMRWACMQGAHHVLMGQCRAQACRGAMAAAGGRSRRGRAGRAQLPCVALTKRTQTCAAAGTCPHPAPSCAAWAPQTAPARWHTPGPPARR